MNRTDEDGDENRHAPGPARGTRAAPWRWPDGRRIAVLVSGRGSNLQALVEARCPVSLVMSNVPGAPALARARAAGIPTAVVDHRRFDSREAFDDALARRLDEPRPADLVVLAGFMRVLGARFAARFEGRLINVHPSLLPAFPGLRTHERALAAGVAEHGCTVHFVTAELDAGPIIDCARVRVRPGDTVESLAARVLLEEHRLLPRVVHRFATGRLCRRGGGT